jgi:iron complex outermembrane recepter protein
LGHTYQFNNHVSNTTSVFITGFNSNASSAGGWTDKATTNFGVRSTFDTRFNVGNNIILSGITGVEYQRQNATTVGYSMVKDPRDTNSVWKFGNPYYWIVGASTSNVYATSATHSLFTEWTLTLPAAFSITAGIGESQMKINLNDRFYNAAQPNKVRQFNTTFKNMVSPHIAINKIFRKMDSFGNCGNS